MTDMNNNKNNKKENNKYIKDRNHFQRHDSYLIHISNSNNNPTTLHIVKLKQRSNITKPSFILNIVHYRYYSYYYLFLIIIYYYDIYLNLHLTILNSAPSILRSALSILKSALLCKLNSWTDKKQIRRWLWRWLHLDFRVCCRFFLLGLLSCE